MPYYALFCPKSTYSSFEIPELCAMAEKADHVVLTGVVAECCVLATALSAIDKAPVDESVKRQIKQSFKMVKYGGNDVIILELASNDKPITYGEEIYIREGNNTKKLESAKATIEYCNRVFGTTEMI